jgi:hypothetical protein
LHYWKEYFGKVDRNQTEKLGHKGVLILDEFKLFVILYPKIFDLSIKKSDVMGGRYALDWLEGTCVLFDTYG